MGDGSSFFVDLPDDVFALMSSRVGHRDLCNLSATCRKLRKLCSSDKLWLPQCEALVMAESINMHCWRNGMHSYKALFRFINGVKPLVGIWVHQNPELGNLVYVTWGFLSVVGCRVIPQELGPRGLDSGLLWAPVFEIIGVPDGSLAFFLHGRERDDYCYPGRFEPAKGDCNVLLLEAESFLEPMPLPKLCSPDSPDSPLVGLTVENSDGEECSRRALAGSNKEPTDDKLQPAVSFGRLSFGDRRRLLELLVAQIRIKMPALANGPLFRKGPSSSKKEIKIMAERHALLLWMYIHGDPCCEPESGTYYRAVDCVALLPKLERTHSHSSTDRGVVAGPVQQKRKATSKKNGFAHFVRSKMKQFIGNSVSQDSKKRTASSQVAVSESKRVQLQDYLEQSSAIGLRLHATALRLTLYRAWPIISENRFALYKMPEQKPQEGREHAGLWGGTFGWPPGKPAEDKPGKALFFLLLSYDECEEGRMLIATKILEGTHYVLHPNGSAMFTAKVDEPSCEVFPWEKNKDGTPVDIVNAYQGEGIANGYGFRYPGAKPGDLFVANSGLLAFVWRESKAVLTLQRLDIQELLQKGEKVAALPPIANFAYLTKANSNVFAGYSGSFGR